MNGAGLVGGMSAASFYAQLAKRIEWRFLAGIEAKRWMFSATDVSMCKDADREIEAGLDFPISPDAPAKERVYMAVLYGFSNSSQVGGFLEMDLKSSSAWLSVLVREGMIEQFDEYAIGSPTHRAFRHYRIVRPEDADRGLGTRSIVSSEYRTQR